MALDRSAQIGVQGLKEFRRELKALESTMPRELTKAGKRVAEMVAKDARASFASRSGVASEVPDAVKSSGAGGASVILDTGRAPSILGHEFGSNRFTQFPVWLGNDMDAGYSLFPTIRSNRERIVETYGDELDHLAARAFPS